MTFPNETIAPIRTWKTKRVLMLVVLPLLLVSATIVGILSYPQASAASSSEEPAFASILKSDYGAEKVMMGRGLLFITVDGKNNVCTVVSERSLEAHEPIKCANMVVLNAK